MAQELKRENKLRAFGVVDGEKASDPRSYLYIEAKVGNRDSAVAVLVRLRGEDRWLSSHMGRNDYAISRDGWVRTTIELPPGTKAEHMDEIGFECLVSNEDRPEPPLTGTCRVEQVSKMFFLDQDYRPGPSVWNLTTPVEIPAGQFRTFSIRHEYHAKTLHSRAVRFHPPPLIMKLMPKARELEVRLERTEQQLRLFQKISRFMVRDMSLQEVLQGIVSLIVEFMECDSCLVYLLDHDELVLCASNTPHPSTIGKVRLRLNEGLTGWVARERRLLAISRDAYKDPRFKYFGELPEDTFEAFLSAPVIARNRVVGVINIQHRAPHQHTGSEMEVLTTVGEQVGCVLVLARMEPTAVAEANHVELVLASGPIQPRP
jgi:uroporphyrinogen-III synthase